MKPFATNQQGKKVTKAGKEYLQHAACMQVHFLEVTALIKRGLRDRLEQRAEPDAQGVDESIFTSVYNWFVNKPVEQEQ